MKQLCFFLGSALILFAQSPKFKDISRQPAATQSAIRKIAAQGMMQGRSDSQFAPDAPITRAEFAVAMQKMFDLRPVSQTQAFPDVPPSSPNYAAVQAVLPHLCRSMLCFRCALTKNFQPDEIVSRAEMTMVLSHILVSQGKLVLLNESETKATLAGVSDGVRIPLPARPFFATAIKNKVVALKEGNTMALPANPSRAEIAECMMSVQKKFRIR